MTNGKISLAQFQKLNGSIYAVTNDRSYSLPELFSRLHRHITQVLKAVRKEKHEDTLYHLCMSLSWAFAMANRLHIDVATEMWSSYPGLCPYCLNVPCSCKIRRAKRRKLAGQYKTRRPRSLRNWQRMFAKIYPNIVIESAIHLAEEAGEVGEATRIYLATHNQEWFKKIVLELIDAITNIFGEANCLGLDLADGMALYFSNGCPGCHRVPCKCPYVIEDRPH